MFAVRCIASFSAISACGNALHRAIAFSLRAFRYLRALVDLSLHLFPIRRELLPHSRQPSTRGFAFSIQHLILAECNQQSRKTFPLAEQSTPLIVEKALNGAQNL